jgi:hypothetical protein
MKRIMLVLTIAVVMVAVLLFTAGTVLAAPGNNGKGATKANANASSGITTAVNKSGSCGSLCE